MASQAINILKSSFGLNDDVIAYICSCWRKKAINYRFFQLPCSQRFVATFPQKKALLVFFSHLMAIFQAHAAMDFNSNNTSRTTRLCHGARSTANGTEIISGITSSPGFYLFGHLKHYQMRNVCSQKKCHFWQFLIIVLDAAKKIQPLLTPSQPNVKSRLNLLGETRILMWFI